MLDQVEEGLLTRVDVVEHDHERSTRGRLLERLPERPGDLLGGGRIALSPEQGSDRRRRVGVPRHGVQLLQHLDHGPVRDPIAVGQASSADSRRLQGSDGFRYEPRLADARVADDRDQLAVLFGHRPLPGLAHESELALAVDETRLVAALRRRPEAEKPVGGNRLGLPAQLEPCHRLALDCFAHEHERGLAQEHFAGRGRLLQACRHVDSIAGCETLRRTGHNLAAVETDPRLEAELGQRLPHLSCGPHRAQGIVFVDDRHTEDGHDGVTDELLDRSAVALDDCFHPLEVARQKCTQRLGVDRFAELGRSGHVAEEDGDGLPLLAGRLRAQGRSAVRTERGRGADLQPAAQAGSHGRERNAASATDPAGEHPRTGRDAALPPSSSYNGHEEG